MEGNPVELGKIYRFMQSLLLFERPGFLQVALTEKGKRIMRLIKNRDE